MIIMAQSPDLPMTHAQMYAAIGLAILVLSAFGKILHAFYGMRKDCFDAIAQRDKEISNLATRFDSFERSTEAQLRSRRKADRSQEKQLSYLSQQQAVIMTRIGMDPGGSGRWDLDDEEDN